MRDVAAIVLAAGKGTRFRSERAKVLHRAAGRSLVGHVLEALDPLGLGQVLVVVGHQSDAVSAEVTATGVGGCATVLQPEQRGTGHAVQTAVPHLADGVRRVVVVPGDTPLLTTEWLRRLLEAGDDGGGAMLTAELEDPTGYGRVIRGGDGDVRGVVEERDASDGQRRIREINAGMYVFDRSVLDEVIAGLDDANAQGELYLTDVVARLAADGRTVRATAAPADVVAGVNDRAQLAEAAAVLRRRHLHRLMTEVGVTVTDPAATYVDVDVEVGADTELLPGTILEAGTRVGNGAVIGPDTHLTGCDVGDGAVVHSTRGDDAVIGAGANVGPFTHLRTGTRLGDRTRAGAFVETKNAVVAEGSKVPHLAYLGDAVVGTGVNVSCGVVTVNYDGAVKSQTTIEDGAFVGCDTMLIAPVTVGAGAYTAAGSVITDDVPADALAIARSRQSVKEGWAARRREHG